MADKFWSGTLDEREGQKDFGWQQELPEGAVAVNGRAWFQDLDGLRAVFVDQARLRLPLMLAAAKEVRILTT